MRQRLRMSTIPVVVTVGLVASSGWRVGAQGTTPPSEPPASQDVEQGSTPAAPISALELAPGVTVSVFAGVPSERAPDQTVYVARFLFEPGSEIGAHRHPGTTVLAVESGALSWTLLEGTAHVMRQAAAGNTGPVEDVAAPGTEVVLEVGDAIYYEDDVIHTARGASDDPTVLLGTLVLTAAEPLLIPADEDAASTSAPESTSASESTSATGSAPAAESAPESTAAGASTSTP